MAKEKGTFGIIGKAWETAKIYEGSNAVKKFDAVVQGDSLKTLGEFVRDGRPAGLIEKSGIDFDQKEDDRLDRYNIVKITPTRKLDEVENPMEMYLITDEHGHDIGTYEITENGPVFNLSPKIKDYNDKMIKENGFGEAEQEILKSVYEIKTIEKLAEKLSKGEDLLIENKDKANSVIRESIRANYAQQGMQIEGSDKELSPEEEKEMAAQKKVIERVPADMRDEVYDFMQKTGARVKEVLLVDNPEQVANRIDNRKNQIKEHGGPLLLLKTVHGGADSIGDDVYTIQDGQPAKQDEANDTILKNVMDNHKDEGHVKDLDSDDDNTLSEEEAQKIININKDKAARAQAIIEKAKAEIKAEEAEIQNAYAAYNDGSQPDKEQMLSEVQGHQNRIGQITIERDLALSGLMDRDPEYHLDGSDKESELEEIQAPEDDTIGDEEIEPNHDVEEEQDDQEKNRWDSANPFNGPNSSY